jgi:uncharacterized protein (TIGR00270 family)
VSSFINNNMAICELCGNEVGKLYMVKIAGSTSRACDNCKGLGKVVEEDKGPKSHSFYRRTKHQTKEVVIDDYASIVSSTIAKKGLTVKKLADISNIKESSLTKYLSGKIHIDVGTARKLEKALGVSIVETVEEVEVNEEDFMSDEGSGGLSLGDLIKKKLGK